LSENQGGMGNFFRRRDRWATAEEMATAATICIFEDFRRWRSLQAGIDAGPD
jgi:hypothetical protein